LCYVVAIVAALASACGRQSATERSAPPSSTGTGGTSGSVPPVASQGEAARTAASVERVERDPDALKALEDMGRYLRTLKAFQIRSETSRDEVLQDGQKVEYDGVANLLVERPNHLRAEVTSDKQQRLYFADGTSFSVLAPRVNYYATIPEPATLGELADTLADKYNVELPIVDLFYWGYRKSTDEILGAIDLGASQVDGVTCEHYAFRQEGVDWQIWIQQGDFPLPRKLVITTTTDAARPQFTSVMTWNLAPSYNEAAFTFVPPKDARRIEIAERSASSSEE
jgi:hypothetical protein